VIDPQAPVVRTAGFPEDTDAVASLVRDYLLQTEAEKVERGLADANAPLGDRYAREIADPAAAFADKRTLVTTLDGVPCGVLIVGAADADGDEIKRFWTSPASRGRGVGRALLRHAIADSARPLRLSVWAWRENAIGMYLSLGFTPVESWDPRPDLVCMRLA
jgi:GNAT superfamily N-acetyltransferase